MSRLFPFRSAVDLGEDREPRLVDVDEDAADEVFDALSSGTARRILAALHEEPHTTSELADAADTSVQNAAYHLDSLREADLVEVVDTWYSERGTEMKVYAPRDESLVVFAGGDETAAFRKLLLRLLGAVGVVAVGWVVLDRTLRALSGRTPLDSGDDAPGGAPTAGEQTTAAETRGAGAGTTGASAETETAAATANRTATATTEAAPSVTPDPTAADVVGAGFPPESLALVAVALALVAVLARRSS